MTITAADLARHERRLEETRDHMTLAERVNVRRQLDRAAGIVYAPPSERMADEIATLLVPKLSGRPVRK